MAEYIERKAMLDTLYGADAITMHGVAVIHQFPAADVVSCVVHKQVQEERDIAVEQLASYGVSLGEQAELAPVKHGRWFLLDKCSNEGVYCSVCSKKVYRTCYANQKLRSRYCPNCGAKMDLTDLED